MDELHPLVEVGQVLFGPLVEGDVVQVVAPDAADILVGGGDSFSRPGFLIQQHGADPVAVDRQLVAENPVDAKRTGDVCTGGCAVEQRGVSVKQLAGGGPRRQHRRYTRRRRGACQINEIVEFGPGAENSGGGGRVGQLSPIVEELRGDIWVVD
jgi:hypothetical protein